MKYVGASDSWRLPTESSRGVRLVEAIGRMPRLVSSRLSTRHSAPVVLALEDVFGRRGRGDIGPGPIPPHPPKGAGRVALAVDGRNIGLPAGPLEDISDPEPRAVAL